MKKKLIAILLLCFVGLQMAFTDVQPGSWYDNAVTQMAQSGWLSGYPDGTFRPNAMITHAEFASVVARCKGLAPMQPQTNHWAAGMAEAVRMQGWADWDELPPTGSNYDTQIPRQLAVKILMKAFLPNAHGDYNTESRKMADFGALDGRYYETVLAAYSSGIVAGDSAGNFRPHDGLSRAEACILITKASGATQAAPGKVPAEPAPAPSVSPIQGGVSQNGWLQVKGTQLCNAAGQPVVLRGMSTHGMQWYGQFASEGAIRSTAGYGANLFRVAMYTGEGGYLAQPAIKQQVIQAVDAAIRNDMYVIIDWHILSDGNPMAYLHEAQGFFSEMAARYQDSPAVLYEICNEPNGNVSWSQDIKPYAEAVIGTIREKSPKAVILVGSSTWSQDLHFAAADPLVGENLMYTLHFYAGTHGADLRQRIDDVIQKGLPVFVSEWGTSCADGSGGVFLEDAAVWLDFLAARGISWANWSLCDKAETSAALMPGVSPNGGWTENDFTDSGKFVFSRFR